MIACVVSSVWGTPRYVFVRTKAYMKAHKMVAKYDDMLVTPMKETGVPYAFFYKQKNDERRYSA